MAGSRRLQRYSRPVAVERSRQTAGAAHLLDRWWRIEIDEHGNVMAGDSVVGVDFTANNLAIRVAAEGSAFDSLAPPVLQNAS